MKVLRALVCVACWTVAAAAAPKVRVEPASLDFGAMQAGTKAEKQVMVHNDGDAPLTVLRAKGNCGCATIDPPEGEFASIQPGHSARVPVRFDATGRMGKQSAIVAITTNDPERPAVMIDVSAYVETLAVLRPENGLVWLQSPRGDRIRRTAVIVPGDPAKEIKLVEIGSDNPSLTATATEVTRNGQLMIDVRCSLAKDTPLGEFSATVTARVSVAGEETTLSIPAHGLVVGDVIVTPLEIHPQRKAFQRGDEVGEVLVRASRGGPAPGIVALETVGPLVAELEPARGQDLHRVVVRAAKDAPAGASSASVYIMTSAEDQPISTVPVFFNVASGIVVSPDSVTLDTHHPSQRIELRNPKSDSLLVKDFSLDTEIVRASIVAGKQENADTPAVVDVSIVNPTDIPLGGALLKIETDAPGDESIIVPVLIRP